LIAVYGGALALFSPFCGWLADRSSSRRLPLVFGLFALGGATILLNVGPNIGLLILGRILQGISAAVVWCVGLALLADTVDKEEIGQTMGYVFAAMSVGVLLGPMLGGVVFEKGGYNEVYAMAYILIGVDIALRLIMIEKKVAKKWIKPTAASVTQNHDQKDSMELQEQPEVPDSLPDTIAPSPRRTQSNVEAPRPRRTQSIVDEAWLRRTQSIVGESSLQQAQPVVEESRPHLEPEQSRFPPVVTLLKSRRLLCALWCCMVVAILMTQFDSVLPIYVRDTFHWNSTGAGLIFLPLVLPAILSPWIGWTIDKYGGRWFAVVGFILFAPFEILLRLVDHNSIDQKVLLCALLTFIGLMLNLCTPPIMVEITSVVEDKERQSPGLFGSRGAYAQAYGLFNFAWAAGCLIGPIWAGFVNEGAGWGTMSWTLALLSALTAIPAGLWTEGWFFKKNKRRWRDRFIDEDEFDPETAHKIE
jgi:MFS family permease